MLDAEGVHGVADRKGALRLVVAADAEVVVSDVRQVVPEPQGLIERHRVVDLAVEENVVARRLEAQRVSHRAAWYRGVQVWRVIGTAAERVDEKRALVLDQRAAEAEAVVNVLFGTPRRYEWAASAQAIVAHQ